MSLVEQLLNVTLKSGEITNSFGANNSVVMGSIIITLLLIGVYTSHILIKRLNSKFNDVTTYVLALPVYLCLIFIMNFLTEPDLLWTNIFLSTVFIVLIERLLLKDYLKGTYFIICLIGSILILILYIIGLYKLYTNTILTIISGSVFMLALIFTAVKFNDIYNKKTSFYQKLFLSMIMISTISVFSIVVGLELSMMYERWIYPSLTSIIVFNTTTILP